jgi:penicillin-binding protein 1A
LADVGLQRSMTEAPVDGDRNRADLQLQPESNAQHADGNRTAAAGREFIRALRHDFAVNLRGLARSVPLPRPSAAAPRSRKSTASRLWRVLRGLIIILAVVAIAIAGTMFWALQGLPLDGADAAAPENTILVEAANGEPLGRIGAFRAEEAAFIEFPDHLVKAVLSIEDRRFYSHWGVDPRGIARALRRNMAAGDIVEGGSTITQQLVKIQMLNNERTFARKVREAFAAVWLETRLSKDEILTRYMNTVYMGASAHGMPAAARLYFDKDISEVTLAEAALLAGLIRAPSQYNPLADLALSRRRAATVLDTMAAIGAISRQAAAEALAAPAVLNRPKLESHAGMWFVDWLTEEASNIAGSFRGVVRMRTTVMPELQNLAEQAVADALASEGRTHGVSQAALVAMRPDGAVVAMVGGRDYEASQFNRAAQALRQPGSAFKLFVYLAALRNGFTLEDTIEDGPIEIDGWKPENFGGKRYGRVTLAEAFAQSINTVAVRLALDVGLEEVISAARDLGIDSPLPKHPSLALGAAEVSLLDLTGAYASVRANATPVQPWGIAAFGGEDQAQLYSVDAPVQQRRSLAHQSDLVALLRLAVESGTGRQAALQGFAAGKTGTSQDHRDAWFIGFNEALVVGVWVGNDDGTPMTEVTGGSLPALIWQKFMTSAAALAPANENQTINIGGASTRDPLDQILQPVFQEEAQASCNYRACSETYRSFRTSDCTYQPYSGTRRICPIAPDSNEEPLILGEPLQPLEPLLQPAALDTLEKLEPNRTGSDAASEELGAENVIGALSADKERAPTHEVPAPIAQPEPVLQLSPDAPAATACDVNACSAEYRSFRASDCTFQPLGGGPRQLCETTGSARTSPPGQAAIPEQQLGTRIVPPVGDGGSVDRRVPPAAPARLPAINSGTGGLW